MQSLRELETQAIVPFETLRNFRDLGGYPKEDGCTTNRGKFYRSPGLYGMTDVDRAHMLTLGLSCIVDLRTAGEIEREPDPFGEADGIAFYNVPLIDNLNSGERSVSNMTLAELYLHLVDDKQAGLKEVFSIFARHVNDGGCVFHCTAGKDRTGVVAALLLMLAGVSEEDIIHNYAATIVLMKEVFEKRLAKYAQEGRTINTELFGSDAQNMRTFIDHMKANYGTAESYLKKIGLSASEIDTLRDALAG